MIALIVVLAIIMVISISDYAEKRLKQKNEIIKLDKENKEKERKDNIRGYVVETRGRLMSLASEIHDREIEVKNDPKLTQKQADDIVEYLHRIRVGIYKLHDEE